MESLGYDHDRSHPKYSEFMMDAGMCMSSCPAVETDLFRAQFSAKADWYQKAKSSGGNCGTGGDGSGGSGGNGGNGGGAGGLPSTTGALGNATVSATGPVATATEPAVGSPSGTPQNGASALASGIFSIAAALLSAVALL